MEKIAFVVLEETWLASEAVLEVLLAVDSAREITSARTRLEEVGVCFLSE
jgi:hypothetical protein